MSLMALSNSTLSGCWVSLVIGFSYFLRRRPQERQQRRQRRSNDGKIVLETSLKSDYA